MAANLKTNETESENATDNYKLFSYWIIIVIFLGLFGNIFALRIFIKDVLFKRRSTTIYYKALSCSSLFSSISYTLSYVNSTRNSGNVNTSLCRVAVSLEVAGYATHAALITVLNGYSLLKTMNFAKRTALRMRTLMMASGKLRPVVQCCIWLAGITSGLLTAWGINDAVISESRKSCELRWTDETGEVTWYRLALTFVWIYVPGLITLLTALATYRVKNRIMDANTNNMRNVQASLQAQRRSNKVSHTLAGFFFVSVILYHTISLVATPTRPSLLSSNTYLVFKLLFYNHVVYGPFIFVFMSATYRGHVGRILTCGSAATVAPTLSGSAMPVSTRSSRRTGRSTGSTTSRNPPRGRPAEVSRNTAEKTC